MSSYPPPLFVENTTKERHFNPELAYWFLCTFCWTVGVAVINYAFQVSFLRPIHKRIFRRFGRKYQIIPAPAADADEAVQDAFLKVFTHITSYREEFPFEVWFTRILVNGIPGGVAWAPDGRHVVYSQGRASNYRLVILDTGTRTAFPPIPGLPECDPVHSGNWLERGQLPGRIAMLGIPTGETTPRPVMTTSRTGPQMNTDGHR